MFETMQFRGKSLAQAVRDVLRDAILDGRMRPGDRFFEAEVANQLGVSRTPLREALRLLEADGLVEHTPNAGVIVRAYSVVEISEIFELRSLFEGFAAEKAANHLTRDQLRQLKGSCDKFEAVLQEVDSQGASASQLADLNNEFHDIIITTAITTERLRETLSALRSVPLVYTSFYWYSEGQKWQSLQFHRLITKALEDGDGDSAKKLMQQHLVEGKEYLIDHIRRSSGNKAVEG